MFIDKHIITLRPWLPTDLESLVHFANNEKIARNLTNRFSYPYTHEHGETFLALASNRNPPTILAIDHREQAIGGIGLHPQEDIFFLNAELGYWLAEPYWGKGIATHSVKLMVEYAWQNFKIERIFARPFGSNTASQRVLEKAGFKLEARFENTLFKNGVYEDELVYAIRR